MVVTYNLNNTHNTHTHTHNALQTTDVDITVPPGGLQQYRPAVIKVAVRNPLNSTLTGEGFLQESSASVG